MIYEEWLFRGRNFCENIDCWKIRNWIREFISRAFCSEEDEGGEGGRGWDSIKFDKMKLIVLRVSECFTGPHHWRYFSVIFLRANQKHRTVYVWVPLNLFLTMWCSIQTIEFSHIYSSVFVGILFIINKHHVRNITFKKHNKIISI